MKPGDKKLFDEIVSDFYEHDVRYNEHRNIPKLIRMVKDLEKELDAVRERVLNCQQYTTNSAMVQDGRFMEVVAVKAALQGKSDE